MEEINRYQNQNIFVKVFRNFAHRPPCIMWGLFWCTFVLFERWDWEDVSELWGIYMALSEMKMGIYYTHEELMVILEENE